MAWYTTGTLTATNNSGAITGVGTSFMANVRVGDGVTIAGSTSIHEVVNVTSETQLTVSPVYAGTTGSGKSFGIIPVQGYTKDLADQAKSLLLTYSTLSSSPSTNALAAVTGAADKFPYFTSASAMSTATVTAAARTLLDDADIPAMRTTLGMKNAAQADILGVVTQSGGQATGAIIETGVNGSGRYTRFANGLAICELSSFNMTVAANAHTWLDRTLPTSIVLASGAYVYASGQPDMNNQHYGFNASFPVSSTTCRIVHYNGPSPQQMVAVCILVVGRWF